MHTIQGPLKPAWDGPVKVVSDFELEHHTDTGWVLLASFEEQSPQSCTQKEPVHFPKNDNGYHSDMDMVVDTERYLPASVWKHLVGKTRDTALSESKETITNLEQAVKNLGEELKKGAEDKQAVEQERDRIKAEEVRVQRQLETECEGHRETRDKKRKMEDDLGKLRDAIGGIEFDRILGRGEDQG